MNSIFYILRTGAAWRLMPHDLVKWQTAYHYQSLFSKDGTVERIGAVLREAVRREEGRHHRLAVREDGGKGGDLRGYDAGKEISGTKRHILVDTLGLVLAVLVLPACVQDNWPRLRRVYANGGYAGALEEKVAVLCTGC